MGIKQQWQEFKGVIANLSNYCVTHEMRNNGQIKEPLMTYSSCCLWNSELESYAALMYYIIFPRLDANGYTEEKIRQMLSFSNPFPLSIAYSKLV